MNKSYKITGIDCPNCAKEVELALRSLDFIKSARVDFIIEKLFLEFASAPSSDLSSGDLLNLLKRTVSGLDSKYVLEGENAPQKRSRFFSLNLIVALIGFGFFLVAYIPDKLGLVAPDSSMVPILYALSYLFIGYDILLKCFKNILKGNFFDENFLMTFATTAAFFIGEYTEAVAVMIFYKIGEFFLDNAVKKSRIAIKELAGFQPDHANLIKDGHLQTVLPETLKRGDEIIIKAGEKVPVDACVTEGRTTVDTSAINGEALPKVVSRGDSVLSGYVNIQDAITSEVLNEYENSTAAKILNMVETAAGRKSRSEQYITKFSKIYTPVIIALAVLISVLLPIITQRAFSDTLHSALTFLILSCPCAIVISVPLCYFAGVGVAGRRGVLLKGSNYLETLNQVDTVIFDKTGTLTTGSFFVTRIVPADTAATGADADKLLYYAAYAESLSNHPLARAVVHKYQRDIDISLIKNHSELIGYGLLAEVEGKSVAVGNAQLMKKLGLGVGAAKNDLSVLYVAIDGKYEGFIECSDAIKSGSAEAIRLMRESGVKTVIMLTGDREENAKKTAEELNISQYRSELLPAEKLDFIESYMAARKLDKGKVAFAGDGINDILALSRADIGIAMGGGAQAALESSDMVIMNNDPVKIARTKMLARRVKSVVLQNIVFALLIKAALMITSIFIELPLLLAVFGDVGVTLLTILNSMRLLKNKT
jgi:Cd2+/Zn2+-exporting ATPase